MPGISDLTGNTDQPKVSISSFSNLRRHAAALVAASLALNLLSLALPLALLQTYDRIIPNTSLSTLSVLVAGVLGAMLLETILRLVRAQVSGWIGAKFEHAAGCAAFGHLMESDLCAYEGQGPGVYLERMASLRTLRDYYSGQALITLLDLPFVFLFLSVIWLIGGSLVFVPITLLFLFVGAEVLSARKMHSTIRGQMDAHDRRQNFVIEVLSGMHTVKSMAMEPLMMRRYERLQDSGAETDQTVAYAANMAMSVGMFFSQVTIVAVAAYGSMLVIDNALTVGSLAACTLLAGRTLQPVQKCVSLWTRFQTIRLSRQRMQKIFELPSEAHSPKPQMSTTRGCLELRDISFAYEDGKPVLKGANLTAEVGECIGIVGGNASGKTTLLSIVAGLIKPSSGVVTYAGHDITEYDARSVKRHISLIPQHGALFDGTIIDNITMFEPDLTETAVEVASVLGLNESISKLPLGFYTRIGDGGPDTLPAGLRQRIAIARALIHCPQVILFDEANSSVDGAGDAFLRKTLKGIKGLCTIIMITPRPSLLKLADRLFEIKDGRLVPMASLPSVAPARPEQNS